VEVQSDRGGVAERQGWRCRATGVDLQSDRGGVEVVVDRDACCLEVQKILAENCSTPWMAWHSILVETAVAQHLG